MAKKGPPLSCNIHHLGTTCIGWRAGQIHLPVSTSPPPLSFTPVFVLVGVYFFCCSLSLYLNLSHCHLSLVSRAMCCLSLHAVSQSLLCVTLPLLSHRCLCLTVSFSLICLAYLSCVLSHLTTVSLTETVSFISLGVFVLISPSWLFAKGTS